MIDERRRQILRLNAGSFASGADWADRELDRAAKLGVGLIFRGDPDYPELLAEIADPPEVLYSLGRPARRSAIAVIGSRQPTPYGRRMARRIAGELAAAGAAVVSGLARGIDAEAHEAALAAGGATWAVLGCGLGTVYPPEHRGLADRIAARGGWVLSELPLEAPPLPGHFPRRNRIVSGLSQATVVVEGRARSGSLITARLAAEQGRDVYAVPGPADSPLSEAPHILIGEGAAIWRGASSLGELAPMAEPHAKILEFLGPDARTVEEMSSQLGMPLSNLSGVLLEMELKDLILPVQGQRYAKK